MMLSRQNIEEDTKLAAKLLFLIGLFAQTQISIGGKLGISELAMIMCSPFVFGKTLAILRSDGTLYFWWLILFWLAGAIFVDAYTHNYLSSTMKGIAVPITVFANSICIYVLLRKNLDNLKWLLLGIAISGVISIFIFQRGSAGDVAAKYGWEAGMERVVSYKLFWVFQFMTWLTLPISGWYLKIPKLYAFFTLLFLSAFNLVTGARSAFFVVTISLLLIMFVGKTRQSLKFIKKHAITIIVLLCLICVSVKEIYQYAATHGYMGADEKQKYEQSTKHGSSAFALLMDARADFFIGLFAALDKPIIGHGSVAIDNYGYVLIYSSKYRSIESYERIMEMRREFGARVIPAHSHIINFWMWHGVGGLCFWLCVIVLAYKTMFYRIHEYPPWFGYFAVTIPMFLWDVLFSPFGNRVQETTLFVTFLLISKIDKEQKNAIHSL